MWIRDSEERVEYQYQHDNPTVAQVVEITSVSQSRMLNFPTQTEEVSWLPCQIHPSV